MKKLRIPVTLATLFAVIYAMLPYTILSEHILFLMFACSPQVIISLVIWVLRKGEPSTKKWSEGYFYEDEDIRSVGHEREHQH